MKYRILKWTIEFLVDLIQYDKINLTPSYQRNFIWSKKDQNLLVDTIIHQYPLPAFFIYKDESGKYEMVDGQQRSRTIYGFIKNRITSTKALNSIGFKDCDMDTIMNYRLCIVEISNVRNKDILNNFYVLINKRGKHLNIPEVYKSEFSHTNYLKLSEELLLEQSLIDLDLFSETTRKRMNDRAFVEDLLAYIIIGQNDKRSGVDKLYENDITKEEYVDTKKKFLDVINIINNMNEVEPIANTRYRQRNDFYTLFSFILEHIDQNTELFLLQYNCLRLLNSKDKEGLQIIRPTNEECEPLKEYAINCVSQSNSKTARMSRLKFFNNMLRCKSLEENDTVIKVHNFIKDKLDEKGEVKNYNGYQLLILNQ